MKSFNNQEKQQIIFNAYSNPKYKLDIKKNIGISEHSTVCVDEIELYLKFENDRLIDAKYYATGCAIFISSIEIMIEETLNKTKDQINLIIENYFKLINQKENLETCVNLGKLEVFENIKVHLNRLECASIIYRAYKKGLNG
ncbi:iron-sulfur cluster assembly scaffold protein [Metamycoplasma canadense]|uniref:iron-sulfur cluster assembly scaffold protein n=1 Tax=Metamycoplasma canadense TaxID=29554 RepID=UPI000B05A91A|nr:iron-sulfur cluster assembly scaffold protein [Metamycoplasma canadense]